MAFVLFSKANMTGQPDLTISTEFEIKKQNIDIKFIFSNIMTIENIPKSTKILTYSKDPIACPQAFQI